MRSPSSARGARPSLDGAMAARIAAALADVGAAVVSGLAIGIDGAAHAAAVAAGVPTVAVLGSGHARLFPRAHAGLADGIVADGGAIVSRVRPRRPGHQGHVPAAQPAHQRPGRRDGRRGGARCAAAR